MGRYCNFLIKRIITTRMQRKWIPHTIGGMSVNIATMEISMEVTQKMKK
jgi:hypothetical protein